MVFQIYHMRATAAWDDSVVWDETIWTRWFDGSTFHATGGGEIHISFP